MYTTSRDGMLRALESLLPGLQSKVPVTQGGSVIVSEGYAYSFNDELAFCIEWPYFGADFSGAVLAKPLHALLSKLSTDAIDVRFSENAIVICTRNSESEILMERDLAPHVFQIPWPTQWLPIASPIGDAIEVAGAVVGKDTANHHHLTCLHFTPVHIEACDGVQALRYELALPLQNNHLLRQQSVKAITPLGVTHIAEGAEWLFFLAANGLLIAVRRYYEGYENLDNVFNNVVGRLVRVPTGAGIQEVIERAEIFSAEIGDRNRVNVSIEGNTIAIVGIGNTGRHRENRDINYEGPAIRFAIPPKVLSSVLSRHTDLEIAEREENGRQVAWALKTAGPNFTYVTALGVYNDG